jgi:site-specific DNA-methyltransferase (adenine-specific)
VIGDPPEILTGDCRDLLLQVSWGLPGEPDVFISDPPYREAVHRNATSHSFGKKSRGVRHRDMGFGHLTPGLRDWTCRYAARARRWIVIFSDMESITHWHDGLVQAGATYIRTIPWVRWSSPQLSGDRPPTGCEAVVIAHGKSKGRKHWGGPGNLTHFSQKCLRGETKHRAEKPLDLMLSLVEYFSDAGELVVDPFAGAGTTGLACRILGRRFVGAELDSEWAERARLRIRAPHFSARDVERFNRWEGGADLGTRVPTARPLPGHGVEATP